MSMSALSRVGYARVSTDEQALTAQRDGLAALGVEHQRMTSITGSRAHGLTGRYADRDGCGRRWRPAGVMAPSWASRPFRDAHEIADDLAARDVQLKHCGVGV